MAVPPPDVAERIRFKKSQYTRFADTKQWQKMDTIFVPDATFAFCDADGKVVSRSTPDGDVALSFTSLDSFKAFFEKAFADLQVIHLVGAGELEMVGPDEVKAVFTVLYHAGSKGYDKEPPHETGGGHYHETWVRKGDDWFCKDLWMQRLYHRLT
jgi:hypothetical protein